MTAFEEIVADLAVEHLALEGVLDALTPEE